MLRYMGAALAALAAATPALADTVVVTANGRQVRGCGGARLVEPIG